jgi:hypothetical protein
VRSLSLVFGLLALFTPWIARTSLSSRGKLLNFAILCFMSFPIRYAQEARNYSLLFLLSAACLYAFYELNAAAAAGAPRQRRLTVLLLAAVALLAFTHIFGIMLALSFIAVMVLREPSNGRRAALVLYAAALTAATLWPLLHGGAAAQAGGNFWIKFGPKVVAVELLKLFTPAGLALLAYALVRWRTAASRVRFDAALFWTLMPFAMMLCGSLVVSLHTPIFMAHYLIGLIPAYALLTCWLLRPEVSGIGPGTAVFACVLLLAQAFALTFSPYLFVQEDLRQIARISLATDSRVCYVTPNGTKDSLGAVWGYYIARRYGRPDLQPIVVAESDIASEFASEPCGFWAEGHLARRGVTVLKDHREFGACREVPLGRPGVATATALVDCRGAHP